MIDGSVTEPTDLRMRDGKSRFVSVTTTRCCAPVHKLQASLQRAFSEFQEDSFNEFREFWNRVKAATHAAAKIEPYQYPSPPEPILSAMDCLALPDRSGVYFIWDANRIVYVGQTIKLSSRCNLKSHGRINSTDWISWIEMPSSDLYFAECFYIGALRPERYGGFAPQRNGGTP